MCMLCAHVSTCLCSYGRRSLDGALDAQCALIEFIHKLQTRPLTGPHVIALFDSSVNITKMLIDSQHSTVPATDDGAALDVTLLFQSAHKGFTKGEFTRVMGMHCYCLYVIVMSNTLFSIFLY